MRSLFPNRFAPKFFASTCIISLSMFTAYAPVKAMESQKVAHPYPKAVVQGFMNSCTFAGRTANPELMAKFCTCVVQIFQDHYTLKQFAELDKDLILGNNRSKEMNQISSLCVDATLKWQAGQKP